MTIFDKIRTISILEIAHKLGIKFKTKESAFCFNGHDSKSASLHFYKKKNSWICFGACGCKGKSLDLVMSVLNCEIKEAIAWFRLHYPYLNDDKKYEYHLKKDSLVIHAPVLKIKEEIFKPNQQIYKWIIDNCTLSIRSSQFLKSRGYGSTLIKDLRIRDIPEPKKFFSKLLSKWSVEELYKAGLVRKDDFGSCNLLWWKHVIIFPFYDTAGEIIYLQGRNLINNVSPTYVNLKGISKPIYNLVYLNKLKKGDEIYLMEGVTDTIAALQDKLNAFGVLGATSFNEKYTKFFLPFKIRVIPDNDKGGEKFAETIENAFNNINKKVRIIKPDFGCKDYSEYLMRKNGIVVNKQDN